MAIEVSLCQPNHALGVTDLKSGPVSNSLGDTWDFILSEFRADDPHVAQLVIALKCLVDTDMVWVRVRVDDGGQPNTLFPTVRENRFGFRSIDCGSVSSLRTYSNPDQVVVRRWYLMNFQCTAGAEKWCSGSADNVWHSSETFTLDAVRPHVSIESIHGI